MNKIRILLITLVLSSAILPFILKENKLSSDITVLLPNDPWISSHFDFLRNSQIGSISAISIESENVENAAKIAEMAEKFSNLIKDKPEVKEVFFRIPPEKLTESASFLLPRAPQILTNDDLNELKQIIKPDQVEILVKKHYDNLLRPGGIFQQKLVSSDPLNLYTLILRKIENIGKDSGFKFILKDNGLWSKDGKSYLVLVYTNIPVTDSVEGEKYIEMLKRNLDRSISSPEYSYTIISGHRHAIENQRILKRDITVTLIIAAIGFFLLFAILFKDWKAVFVFIIPIIGMLCAVGLTWLFFQNPSVIILGLGATVIGIALDYGIHVFVCIKRSAEEKITKIIRPLIFSALTTLGVFWAFFFSETPGYHQLAFASTCGIGISLILSIAILPFFLGSKRKINRKTTLIKLNMDFPSFRNISPLKTISIWLILVILSIIAVFFIGFDSDIRNMDGSEAVIKKDKDKFSDIWGQNSQGAVLVTAGNIDSALEQHDIIAKFAKTKKIESYQSLSYIWPSLHTRKQNFKNWNNFWDKNRVDYLKNELREKGEKYGFSESAFDPFFANIHKQDLHDDFTKNKGFSLFGRKFVNRNNGMVTLMAFFNDNKKTVKQLKTFVTKIEDAVVISPRYFGDYISRKILNDAYQIAIIAIFLVLLMAWICLKNPSDTFKALIPVVSATLSVFPIYAIAGWKMNAVALVAMIVVTGLSIDYGIFVVSALKSEDSELCKNAFTALTISMISTIIGSGALLFAVHPALNTVGKVITTGVISGYLSAIFVVPAIVKLYKDKKSIK